MTWLRRSYPILFAAFPVLGVAARNPGYYHVSDALILAGIAAAATLIVFAGLWLVLRLRLPAARAADVAAFATLVVVGAFYSYKPLALAGDYIRLNPRMGPALVVAGLVALVAAVLLAVRLRVHRRLPSMADVSRFLTLTGSLVVVGALLQLAYHGITATLAIRRSALVRELARPVPARRVASRGEPGAPPAVGGEPKRDVYVFVLDEFADTDVLRERFGFDNRPFEDSLRALGFTVPSSVRSNYANTLMSVSSFLNFAHTAPLADVMSAKSNDFGPGAWLISHNRTERFLKRRGYTVVFFRSSWYGPTQYNDGADERFDLDPGFHPGWDLQRSEIAAYLAAVTPVRFIMGHLPTAQEVHARDVARTFAAVAEMPRDPRPTFSLAHVLSPHIPYIETADCKPLPRGATLWRDDSPAGRAALANQMRCVDHQVLTTVRALITRSDPKPIIILQGDHGTQSLGIFESRKLPTTAQARERFQAFGAYYLPDGGAAVMPDSLTIVNVMRYVLGYYFHADLPPLPDTMYYSYWQSPYDLTPVDDDFHVVTTRADAEN
ncbi:MAG TPA: sulfatase-like hydrolase/transferase [Gemmatimonadaceae bacterium]